MRATAPLVQEKIERLGEYPAYAGFLFGEVEPDRPARPDRARAAAEALEAVEPWDAAAIEAALRALCERLGQKPRQAFQPIRLAVTGSKVSPGLFESLELLGREESLARAQRGGRGGRSGFGGASGSRARWNSRQARRRKLARRPRAAARRASVHAPAPARGCRSSFPIRKEETTGAQQALRAPEPSDESRAESAVPPDEQEAERPHRPECGERAAEHEERRRA